MPKKPQYSPIFTDKTLVRGESKKLLGKIKNKIFQEEDPQTELERILCERIISDTFRHRRILDIEKVLIEKQQDDARKEKDSPEDLLERYTGEKTERKRRKNTLEGVSISDQMQALYTQEKALSKSITRSIQELRQLKKQRLKENNVY